MSMLASCYQQLPHNLGLDSREESFYTDRPERKEWLNRFMVRDEGEEAAKTEIEMVRKKGRKSVGGIQKRKDGWGKVGTGKDIRDGREKERERDKAKREGKESDRNYGGMEKKRVR